MIPIKSNKDMPIRMKVNPATPVDVGRYYIPDVDEDGTLTWEPSVVGMDPIAPQNIKGPKPIKGIDYWTPEEQNEVSTATGAAKEAAGEANSAAAKANQAASEVSEAVSDAVKAADDARKAAEAVSKAGENAEAAAGTANQAAGEAASAAGDARAAANAANDATRTANDAANNANTAATAATAIAKEIRQARDDGEFKGDPFTYDDFTPEQLEALTGAPGVSGVYLGSDNPPESANVWVDPNGEPTSTERWVFTLEDGTTVTKTVVVV